VDNFSASFAEARTKFLAVSRAAGARTWTYGRDDLAGRDGEALACDVAVLGDPSSVRAAIVVTGTHGSEGYCGAAILHRWLSGLPAAPEGVKIVLVHAINPWAFSYRTRATENNVDLNRNFFARADGFVRPNPSYDLLAPYLHGSARDAASHLEAYLGYQACLKAEGAQVETRSWEGQSTWPDGIFYTGTGPEWSNTVFRRIVNEHLSPASRIGFIDFHTGIGRYGEVVHLVFRDFAAAAGWWPHQDGGDSAFRTGEKPAYEGLLCRAIGQELPEARVAGAVIEFGVADDYAVFRSDRLDRWLRFEGRDDPDRDRLRADCMNIICPEDIAWRRSVLANGPPQIDFLLSGLCAWES